MTQEPKDPPWGADILSLVALTREAYKRLGHGQLRDALVRIIGALDPKGIGPAENYHIQPMYDDVVRLVLREANGRQRAELCTRDGDLHYGDAEHTQIVHLPNIATVDGWQNHVKRQRDHAAAVLAGLHSERVNAAESLLRQAGWTLLPPGAAAASALPAKRSPRYAPRVGDSKTWTAPPPTPGEVGHLPAECALSLNIVQVVDRSLYLGVRRDGSSGEPHLRIPRETWASDPYNNAVWTAGDAE